MPGGMVNRVDNSVSSPGFKVVAPTTDFGGQQPSTTSTGGEEGN